MDVGIRAARDQVAMERMLAAADVLSGRFDLGVMIEPVPKGQARDPAVATMMLREQIADFLDALVKASEPIVDLPSPAERMADLTVIELREEIAGADAETLGQLEALERAGKNRSTVMDMIERRGRQLHEAENEREAEAEPEAEPEPEPASDEEPTPEPPEDAY